MLAILLYLGENLERTYFLRYTTRLKSCPRVRMNLFSKSCFPISWTNTSLLVIPLVGRWYNSVQMTKIRLWVVTLLELNQKILLLCKLWIVLSKDFWSCYSSTYLVISGDNCQHHVCKIFVLLWFAIHGQMNSFILEHCMNCCLIG
jgi:hypothetical protein